MRRHVTLTFLLLCCSPASAAGPTQFVTEHSIEIDGERLDYTAVAGETWLRAEDGSATASVFTFSYFLKGADPAERPVTFLFNGGPGSSSIWLHLGAFGPRRIVLPHEPVAPGGPPYELAPNRQTLLRVSDLVFVDPIGTGFSRAITGESSDYWGVDEDAESVAEFVRVYLTEQHRWTSPKYLLGESYGTIRASLLVRELQLGALDGLALNGVVLLSTALDPRIFLSGRPGNELAYVTNLPTYAAAAYYHDRLPESPPYLDRFLDEAREFAAGEYMAALFRGDTLPPDRVAEIAGKLHRFTGLSEAFLRRSNLRVGAHRFAKELLRDRGETIAFYDTRFRGRDPDAAGEHVQWDPFLTGITGPFTTAMNAYLGDELEVELERTYEVFTLEANGSWKRPRHARHVFSGHLYATPPLAEAAATNAEFRIFVASGYHDLTTTFFGVEYVMNHSGIDRDRITLRNYDGGHMMYLHEPSHDALGADLRAFYRTR